MVPAAEVRVDECYELPDDGSIGLIKRRNLMVKAIDAVLASLRLTLSRNFLIAQRFISGCVPEIATAGSVKSYLPLDSAR
jgi:hypothetical protein